jgi:hypothetical protein
VTVTEHTKKVSSTLLTNGSSSLSLVPAEIETIHKPVHKIRRSRPLPSKCLDPAQCLDIIDDMYDVYFELEVFIIYSLGSKILFSYLFF